LGQLSAYKDADKHTINSNDWLFFVKIYLNGLPAKNNWAVLPILFYFCPLLNHAVT